MDSRESLNQYNRMATDLRYIAEKLEIVAKMTHVFRDAVGLPRLTLQEIWEAEPIEPIEPIAPPQCPVDANSPRKRFSRETKQALFDLQEGKCGICHGAITGTFQIDHLWPVSHGGDDNIDNLQAVHPKCNRYKANRFIQGERFGPLVKVRGLTDWERKHLSALRAGYG